VAVNIKYGAPEATAAEVQAAARAANADYFISHLKDRYATILHHGGAALSEGERQLLAVARAEASQKPVLVLDEATSSIDSLTEMRVTKGLDTLMQGKTVLVIAHRLSTIRKADLIIVLEQGRMAEMGSHAELMERKGLYYSLYTKAG
jgi:ATP-binding cassette subfamily B protein